MNDPLGLFGDDTNEKDPLGLFEESFLDKAKGVGEAALTMVAGTPAQIASGLSGIGSLMMGEGFNKAAERVKATQRSNFGFGEYSPSTETGQRYAENVGGVLQKPVDWAGAAGEALAGNEGRYVGELLAGSAMELLDPAAMFVGAKGLAGRKPKAGSKTVSDIRTEAEAVKPMPKQDPLGLFLPTEGLDGQLPLFIPEVEGRGISPYEANPGDWRIDENGIPVRVDLSLEAQNLQNPLQMNLWGDELNPGNFGRDPAATLPMDQDIPGYPRMSEPISFRNDPENQMGITDAMNQMDPAARTAAIQQTQLGREQQASGELRRRVAAFAADAGHWRGKLVSCFAACIGNRTQRFCGRAN